MNVFQSFARTTFDYEEERAIDVKSWEMSISTTSWKKRFIYMKEDFSDEDGVCAAELEGEFYWEAEWSVSTTSKT